MSNKKLFINFIESVCTKYGATGAIKPLVDGFNALTEASMTVPSEYITDEYVDLDQAIGERSIDDVKKGMSMDAPDMKVLKQLKREFDDIHSTEPDVDEAYKEARNYVLSSDWREVKPNGKKDPTFPGSIPATAYDYQLDFGVSIEDDDSVQPWNTKPLNQTV